ncbi:hypothetical protein GCM10009550_15870 [Actinocorallia libanotica]|uniref:Uncharacterized protein n=1 Tax=Actinocorallia libanotica TaxID=46162 RepID=A0ABN1QKQ5_9ACTN
MEERLGSVAVLPAPFGPKRVMSSPSGTSGSRPLAAVTRRSAAVKVFDGLRGPGYEIEATRGRAATGARVRFEPCELPGEEAAEVRRCRFRLSPGMRRARSVEDSREARQAL